MTATLLDDELNLLQDVAPTTEAEVCKCQVCGVELVYAGTGRKPTKCDEHKRTRVTAAKGAAKRSAPAQAGGNEKLAAQAADVLFQVNEMLSFVLMLGKLFNSASALSERNEAFRDQAYEALKVDPGLCRTIVSAGAKSGKISLLAAYGVLGASVAPVAVDELRELRAAKAARLDAEMAEAA